MRKCFLKLSSTSGEREFRELDQAILCEVALHTSESQSQVNKKWKALFLTVGEMFLTEKD